MTTQEWIGTVHHVPSYVEPEATSMNVNDPQVLVVAVISSVFLILAIILILSRSRTTEMKLVLIGVFMAIAAGVQPGTAGVSVNPGQVAMMTGLGSAALTKVAVILILAGVGMMLMSRVSPSPTARAEEERSHVD
jgi:hypothetical protein